VYNFAEIPTVHSLDEFWHQKYTEDEDGRLVKLADQPPPAVDLGPDHGVHLPSPSYWPIVASSGLPIIAYGIVYGRGSGASYVISVVGALILLFGLYAWGLEPSTEPEFDEPEADDNVPALVGADTGTPGELGTGEQPAATGEEGEQ
jgi:cytochrome c oxidase subunit 1